MPKSRLVWFALAIALFTGIALRASHIFDQHRLTPNERAYLYYATRIHDEGLLPANRGLYAEYINNPDMWELAPPVRIGYVMVLEGAMQLTGVKSVGAGMTVSFLASIATLLIVAWMGLRFFNPWVSIIASTLCATSFVEIWLVRGTPQDGVFGLAGLLAIWIVCEIMWTPDRRWLYIAFHAVGIWAILIKQSGVFIYGFSALVLLIFLIFHRRAYRQAVVLAACVAGGVVVACGTLVFLAGDAQSAWRVYQLGFLCNDEAWNYQEECCFGPWIQVPRALFLLSPLTFLLAIVGIAVLAMPRVFGLTLTPVQRYCGAVCTVMAVGFVFLFSFFPRMQILRYVSPGDGAVCLIGAVGLWCLLSNARQRMAAPEYRVLLAFVVAGFVFSMVRDYSVFDKVAMQAGLPELGAELIRFAAVGGH